MKDNMNTTATLVLGGTGKTGRRVAERLAARGLPVRIASRSGEHPFDWEDEATWAPALHGVGSAYVSYYPDLGSNAGTGGDFAVVKLDGASGAEIWRTEINGAANGPDGVASVAVDAGGNVIAGGFLSNAGTNQDFTVVKLAGANGAALWRREITGTENGLELVSSVAVDGDGNAIAGGRLINAGTQADFTVVKLDGVDGSDFFGDPLSLATALVDSVVALNLQMGIANSLVSKLDAVVNALDDVNANNDVAAINALQAFINAVAAQSGGMIDAAAAAALIAASEQIITLLSEA